LKSIVYLHGFASSPHGRKITALGERLGPEGFEIVAPDLNVPSFEKLSFEAMTKVAAKEIERRLPAVVVGSSLGALVALEAARPAKGIPLVLIAPALGFGGRWNEKLAPGDPVMFFHFDKERELPIHRRFFDEMAAVTVDRNPPESLVTVIMGAKDESVPYELVQNVWKSWEVSGLLVPGSRFITVPDGDHGLVENVNLLADEVRVAALG
jgi:uncharacterized protein